MRLPSPQVVLFTLALGAFLAALWVGGGYIIHRPLAQAQQEKEGLPSLHPPKQCTVLRVYDGDTLACDMNHNGKLEREFEKVRLLSIDATEMHYSPKNASGKNQPMALEAKQALEVWLGQTVTLKYDVKPYDKYGRHLAFVYPANKGESAVSLNETLVAQGLVRVWVLSPNHGLEKHLLRLQSQAQVKGLGLWQPNQGL